MAYAFQKLDVTPQQKLYLKAVVDSFEKREKVSVKDLRIDIYKETGPGFDPKNIDSRLINPDLITPTLLGIWHVDEKHKFIRLTDRLLKYIKERILAHNLADVTAEDVANHLKVNIDDVKLCFELVQSIGSYWGGATRQNLAKPGFDKIVINHDFTIDAYLEYEDLSSAVTKAANLNTTLKVFDKIIESQPNPAKERTEKDTAFIIMSMDPNNFDLVDVLNGIKAEFESFGISAIRVDDIQEQNIITEAILQRIRISEFLIADLTYERPNVYYEVGYAQAHGKRPMLIAKDGTRIHFDLTVHNVIYYKNVTELKAKLKKRLSAVAARNAEGPELDSDE